MKIAGLQKLTLLDFPGHTACTVFTLGCNFRCPFCHNSDILRGSGAQLVLESDFFDFLKTRVNKLEGVCITGGEPLLQPDIVEFMQKIREMGFLIKLDTNGSNYEKLQYILQNKLCDYVAMDVKNTPEKYDLSCGGMINLQNVLSSIELIKNQTLVDYEFRTTVVKQLNEKDDFKAVAHLLKGAKRYYLQQFKDCEKVLKGGFSAYNEQEMQEILEIVKANGVETCLLRGI